MSCHNVPASIVFSVLAVGIAPSVIPALAGIVVVRPISIETIDSQLVSALGTQGTEHLRRVNQRVRKLFVLVYDVQRHISIPVDGLHQFGTLYCEAHRVGVIIFRNGFISICSEVDAHESRFCSDNLVAMTFYKGIVKLHSHIAPCRRRILDGLGSIVNVEIVSHRNGI